MSDDSYSPEELEEYFSDPESRRRSRNASGEEENAPSGNDPVYARARSVLKILTLLLTGAVLGLGVYMWTLTDELPSLHQLENPELQLATVVYTADGREMARFRRQNRTWVSYDEISPHAFRALVSIEDRRFFEHWGVDLFRTLTVPYHLLRGEPQGASTITQQLARNLYQQQIGYEVSLKRKLKEMITAVQIERNYTKREILEMYLNTVTFGHNSYGIESAAYTYFGTNAAELDLLQSATLVGILRATTYYNPVNHPERAQRRRNLVLAQMVDQGYLSRGRYERIRERPVDLDFHSASSNARMAPYFTEQVRQQLNEWAEESGHDIYTGGLVVHTTLDSRLQAIADSVADTTGSALQNVVDAEWAEADATPPEAYDMFADAYTNYWDEHPDQEPFQHFWQSNPNLLPQFVRQTERYRNLVGRGVAENEAVNQLLQNQTFVDSLKRGKTTLQLGFVAIDPNNGHVKAWVGGRDFDSEKYDHVALARRQPGSTFKPFVYTAAVDNGYSPYYRLPDDTITFVDPHTEKEWKPMNFSGTVTGDRTTLRNALVQSKNTVTARLVQQIGPERVVTYARRMGIRSPLNTVPSIALGTSNVTLLELTSAYATLANRGLHSEPQLITRIEDRYGNVIAQFAPERDVALSEQTTYTMIDMLRGAIAPDGTGFRIRSQYGIDHDVVGKTGTTQNSADGWFMLAHPELVAGAWTGFNDQNVTFRTQWWGQGAHNALHLVGGFFRAAINSPRVRLPDVAFLPPDDYERPLPNPVDSTTLAPDSTTRPPALPVDDRTEW